MASTILEEYLFALGFKMDEKGKKTFETTLKDFEKRANSLAKGLFQVAAATSTMVGVFAYQMEKLYYASKRIGSSVSNIQALEYGAEQIGISGDTMRASLENLAKTIRLNPGISKLIESFGVPVEGRDTSDVARDLVKALASMPHYLGAQFANLFGIDEATLLMWKQGMGVMDAAVEKRKQMASSLGVDVDAAAEASKDLLNTWRELAEFMKLFGALVVQTMLPALKDMAGVVKAVLSDWGRILQSSSKPGSPGIMSQLGSAISTLYSAPFRRSESKLLFSDVNKRAAEAATVKIGPAPGSASSPVASGPAKPGSAAADFAKLEQKYGLPAGLLDRIWQRESNRGQDMLSPAGAKGHFQFMDATASQYGVTDPNDLGQSSEGAARYMRDLLTQYGGDLRKATGAYNWGPGNMSKYGPSKAPAETQAYMDAVAGPQITAKTDIYVNGAGDPGQVAAEVARQQMAVNADLVRNVGGNTQ